MTLISRLEAAASEYPLPEKVAIGVEGAELTAWYALSWLGDVATVADVVQVANGHSPDEEIDAVVSISATPLIWNRIDLEGKPALLEVCAQLGLSVFGNVSFFIRYLDEILPLLVRVSGELTPSD